MPSSPVFHFQALNHYYYRKMGHHKHECLKRKKDLAARGETTKIATQGEVALTALDGLFGADDSSSDNGGPLHEEEHSVSDSFFDSFGGSDSNPEDDGSDMAIPAWILEENRNTIVKSSKMQQKFE
jgi:hypothetical protein